MIVRMTPDAPPLPVVICNDNALDRTSGSLIWPFLRVTLPSLHPLADKLSVSRIVRRRKPAFAKSPPREKISHLPSIPTVTEISVPTVMPPPPERVSTKTSSPDDSAAAVDELRKAIRSVSRHVKSEAKKTALSVIHHPRLMATHAKLVPTANDTSLELLCFFLSPSPSLHLLDRAKYTCWHRRRVCSTARSLPRVQNVWNSPPAKSAELSSWTATLVSDIATVCKMASKPGMGSGSSQGLHVRQVICSAIGH